MSIFFWRKKPPAPLEPALEPALESAPELINSYTPHPVCSPWSPY
jgi:hypothetical protein